MKRYISNASVADVYIVYGATPAATTRSKGLTAVAVPKDARGISFPRSYTFMGRRGCIVGEVKFDDCRVPADQSARERRGGGFASCAACSTSSARSSAVPASASRAARSRSPARTRRRREAFGQKLGCKQLIWDKIAEMSWRIDAAELITYRAPKIYDAGTDGRR